MSYETIRYETPAEGVAVSSWRVRRNATRRASA